MSPVLLRGPRPMSAPSRSTPAMIRGSSSIACAAVMPPRDSPNMPVRLDGRATGQLEGSLSAAEAGRPREFTSKLELQAPQLRVQGIPTERLHGSIDYRNQAVTYRFEGETLGGRFNLNGQIPSTAAESAPPEGHFHVEGARLGRLAEILGIRIASRSIHGALAIDAYSGTTSSNAFVNTIRFFDNDYASNSPGAKVCRITERSGLMGLRRAT